MLKYDRSIKKHYDKDYKDKLLIIFKSLLLALTISLCCIIIYAIVLSITPVSDNTMSIITQVITMISITIAGIYCGKSTKSKGYLYGLIVGIIFVIILIPISMLWGQMPAFDKYFIAKLLMASSVGFIGGIIGVNII